MSHQRIVFRREKKLPALHCLMICQSSKLHGAAISCDHLLTSRAPHTQILSLAGSCSMGAVWFTVKAQSCTQDLRCKAHDESVKMWNYMKRHKEKINSANPSPAQARCNMNRECIPWRSKHRVDVKDPHAVSTWGRLKDLHMQSSLTGRKRCCRTASVKCLLKT